MLWLSIYCKGDFSEKLLKAGCCIKYRIGKNIIKKTKTLSLKKSVLSLEWRSC